jgi:hypothetical protein
MLYFLVVQFFTLTGQPLGAPIVDMSPTMEECQRVKGLYERILVEQGQETRVVKVYCYNREDYSKFVSESLNHIK